MIEKPMTKAQVDELILLISYDEGYEKHQKRTVLARIKSDWEMRAWGPVERSLGDRLLLETRAFEMERMYKNVVSEYDELKGVEEHWRRLRAKVGM